MFERNRSQNTAERERIAARLVLEGGERLSGHVFLPPGTRFADLLNNGHAFLEFETRDGDLRLINKQAVRWAAAIEVPRADQLARRGHDAGAFDPYAILGVDRDAGPEAIRIAYLGLARAYHPDRFAAVDLPKEMRAYVNAMQTRINLAYRELSGETADRMPVVVG